MSDTSFVKPKVDTTLYLWSDVAIKKNVLKSTFGAQTKYPKNPLTDNTFCKQSTTYGAANQPFLYFNHNIADTDGGATARFRYESNGIAKSTSTNSFSGYNGDWIMINVVDSIVLKKIAIYPRPAFVVASLGKFRIYGTNDITNFNNPSLTSGWTLIHDQTTLLTGYIGHQPKEVIINTTETFSIYIIVVNQLAGNFDFINLIEIELYGSSLEEKNSCLEYNWDVPPITLNQNGKISMETKAYNTFTPSAITTTTRINNLGTTKYNYSSKRNGGVVLDISHWDYLKKKNIICPAIPLTSQTINKISLSIQPENDEDGIDLNSDFVAVLKITEEDVKETRWS